MEKEIFVLEMPLKVEKWQAVILNKRYEYLRQIYNYVQGKLLHQFRYFEQIEEYKACKTIKEKREFLNCHPFFVKGITDKKGNPQPITFNKLSISSFAEKLVKKQIGLGKTYSDVGCNTDIFKDLLSICGTLGINISMIMNRISKDKSLMVDTSCHVLRSENTRLS